MECAKIAITAATEAGKIHKKYFQRGVSVTSKRASYNLLTTADIEAEEKIVSIIKKRFPEHNILAEEEKYAKTKSDFTWIIDPLDGTNNFAFGIPIFCVSIALRNKDSLLLGVIYDPIRRELFVAQKGKGARLNGNKIHVSGAKTLQRSLLVTGFYYDRGPDMKENLEKIRAFFLKRIVGLRRLGAAALDLAYVAAGRVTGFWEFHLSPWDFAAGKLLVEEAGGRVSGRRGESLNTRKKSFVVASNGKIHSAMLKILA